MGVLERILALRPTNAVNRLDGVELPLLNPRDLAAALKDQRAALLCVPVTALGALPGLLRAARDSDAPLGLSCPHPGSHRDRPARFFEAAREAGRQLQHQRPLFLQAGPVRISSANPRTLEGLEGDVFRYIDAGFGLISLDASALTLEDATTSYTRLAQPAVEQELSIEVAVPLVEGRADPSQTVELLLALAREGVAPRFVRLDPMSIGYPAEVPGGWDFDLGLAGRVGDAAARFGASLAIEEHGAAADRWGSGWVEAGVKKVDAMESLARVVLSALPTDALEVLQSGAAEAGVHLSEWLGRSEDQVTLDPQALHRVEALWYEHVCVLAGVLGTAGTGAAVMRYLAKHARY